MNNLRNKVQLIGNLGTDPQVTELADGKKLVRMTIATTEFYKNSEGDRVKLTQWHNLTAWGNNAELAHKYLTKGNEIAVEGKLNHRTYNDQNGNKRYHTEIVVNEILFLNKRKAA